MKLFTPYLLLSMLFTGIEGWMLHPILWRHKWLYLLWVPYCMALGFWCAKIHKKRQRKKMKQTFKIRFRFDS